MSDVLVVDDDEDIRYLIRARAGQAGHVVRGARSGDDALALCAGTRVPDLVLIHLGLGEQAGFALLERLRRLDGCGSVPVIVYSARIRDADAERARSLGAACLTKPFDAATLLARIDEVLAPA